MNKTTLTMAKQINAKELHFAKFQLVSDDNNNSISISKGKKGINFSYNKGSDLYDLEFVKLKDYDRIVVKNLTGVYCDQLQGLIQDYFPRFEYVMDSLFVRKTQVIDFTRGVNC